MCWSVGKHRGARGIALSNKRWRRWQFSFWCPVPRWNGPYVHCEQCAQKRDKAWDGQKERERKPVHFWLNHIKDSVSCNAVADGSLQEQAALPQRAQALIILTDCRNTCIPTPWHQSGVAIAPVPRGPNKMPPASFSPPDFCFSLKTIMRTYISSPRVFKFYLQLHPDDSCCEVKKQTAEKLSRLYCWRNSRRTV